MLNTVWVNADHHIAKLQKEVVTFQRFNLHFTLPASLPHMADVVFFVFSVISIKKKMVYNSLVYSQVTSSCP